MIKGYEYDAARLDPWVFVPREPAAFGHIIVVSGKHYKDISDPGLLEDTGYLKKMMKIINELAIKMKGLTRKGKKCERVYVSTLCETENFHLHFHLIPRFEDDNMGFAFLFETELESARWLLKEGSKGDKNADGYKRVKATEVLAARHRSLLEKDDWARSDLEREKAIEKTKKCIDNIL
jgi:diadenosine tetraphosphate (Ap4A) HIT family hydrolase